MELLKNPNFPGLLTTFIVALPTTVIPELGFKSFYLPLILFLIGSYFYLSSKDQVKVKRILITVLIVQVVITVLFFLAARTFY